MPGSNSPASARKQPKRPPFGHAAGQAADPARAEFLNKIIALYL